MHVIRLRGPWELEPLSRDDGSHETGQGLPAPGRTQVPGDWSALLGDDFCGRVRYTRRFNTPTNLDAHQRVYIAIEAVDHQAAVTLNDRSLGTMRGSDEPRRFDVTPLLAAHNVLVVEVDLPAALRDDAQARGARCGRPGGLVGEVRLEIDP